MYDKKNSLTMIEEAIHAHLGHLLKRLPKGYKCLLTIPPPHFDADYTLSLFQLAKWAGQSPSALGQAIGERLKKGGLVLSYQVIGGFLNLQIPSTCWIQLLSATKLALDLPRRSGKRSLVEFASPNTNKPLHLGHLRNIFLGNAVANLLEERGDEVVRINHINDRGIHICKSMVAYQKEGKGLSPRQVGKKGDHWVGDCYVAFHKRYSQEVKALEAKGIAPESSKTNAPILLEAQKSLRLWEQGDPATLKLWKKMNQWVYEGFDQTFHKIDISFDKTYYESDTYLEGKKMVLNALTHKDFYKKEDGSIWCDLTDQQLGEKLLLRADGTTVYITQDLGTAEIRNREYQFDQAIYVVGNEQLYHFNILFSILKKLNKSYANSLKHYAYGMVELPFGRMKSREGSTVDADDMIQKMIEKAAQKTKELQGTATGITLYEKIGLGAIKYFLLKVHPKKKIFFNPEKSIDFQGDTCAFVQYTYARIQSLLKKYKLAAADPGSLPPLKELTAAERRLCRELYHYKQLLQEAIDELNPSLLVHHCYQLAKAYNSFYRVSPLLKEEVSEPVKAWRSCLSDLTAQVLSKMTQLLGISLPDQM